MKTTNWIRASLMTLAAAAALSACREMDVPLQPEPPAPPPGDSSTKVTRFSPVVCTVNVAEKKTLCGDNDDRISNNDLVVGGQGRYIDIGTSGDTYNINTQTYTSIITVRNRIGQKMGTIDGFTLDPRGVRVFFADGPRMTSGSGGVTLLSIDGYAHYTGGQQPYLQFSQVLDEFQQSGGKGLQFQLPGTVTSFTYTVYVATVVQYPDGWIEVTPATFPIAPKTQWKMAAVQKDVLGDVVLGSPISWTIGDTTIATIAGDGTATAVRAGAVTVTASSGDRSGSATLNVSGIQRTWDGSVDTDWHNKFNWTDDIVPVSLDSVFIPLSAPNDPTLLANAVANTIVVEEGAAINLGPFDLTANGSVTVSTFTQGITNTVGRIILTGTAQTVQGRLARIRVTGTYTMTGSITVRAPIEISGGRLTNGTYRLQAESN